MKVYQIIHVQRNTEMVFSSWFGLNVLCVAQRHPTVVPWRLITLLNDVFLRPRPGAIKTRHGRLWEKSDFKAGSPALLQINIFRTREQSTIMMSLRPQYVYWLSWLTFTGWPKGGKRVQVDWPGCACQLILFFDFSFYTRLLSYLLLPDLMFCCWNISYLYLLYCRFQF